MSKQSLHNLPTRKSIRLKGWDYENPGFYFITICTYQSQHYFGEIKDKRMHLSSEGEIAANIWDLIPNQFPNASLDAFISMPNHLHGIIQIIDDQALNMDAINHPNISSSGISTDAINHPNISSSGISTDAINRVRTDGNKNENKNEINRKKPGGITGKKNPMLSEGNLGRIIRWYKGRCSYEIRKSCNLGFGWHSRFYDHIIRNEKALNTIRNYILKNPENWDKDRFTNVHNDH
tara:strand:+ start:11103 stop:11807 length:705 start_codon:yes stop_codon:yes gene_type:complete